MRDANRIKEKFTLSLDGRQVASVVVGSLVVLGAVFVLGFSVGRQIGLRGGRATPAPADPLAALDAPTPRPDAGEPPPRLSYHEALTRPEPRPAPPPPARPQPGPQTAPPPAPVQPPRPAEAAPQPPAPAAEKAAPAREKPAPAPQSAPRPSPAPPAPVPSRAAVAEAEPSFAIQVGASQDRGEAERIAEKFRAQRPRVVEALVPGKGRWYRVKVGAFASKGEAEHYLRDLARETGAKGFVTGGN